MEENSKPPKPAESAASRASEESSPESVPPDKKWENVVLWLFIAGLLIASVIAAYVFWRKLSEHLN